MRLQEIFANGKPFRGIIIIGIRDFYQLKPVFDGKILEELVEGYGSFAQKLCCDLFKMPEWNEIMRQKGDRHFAKLN